MKSRLQALRFTCFEDLAAALGRPRANPKALGQFLRMSAAESWREVLRRDPCAYCGQRPGGTIDHIVSRSTGGADNTENLTGACKRCNSGKGSLSLLDFLLSRQEQHAIAEGAFV